jgi:predicted transposase/invertase (TIGR01784 family)
LEDYIDFDEMLAEAQAKVEEIEAKLEEAQAMAAEQQAKAKAEGRTQGRAEGEKHNQIETAKRMLNENLSAELISKLTGLSQDEVDKLR